MSSWAIGIIELMLLFVPVLGWGLWELWSLNREKKRDLASAERARHAEGQHGPDDRGPQSP
ncbi:hypothetical protein GGR13_001586 [Brevundimonas variabilis]|uniref:Uncharacterized protein n=1 Tax=Brevundimonas variabilis TaxID=74312 RepID=A0A7W9CI11_9CAUL|nr:hypothetical protein [Brevundimonas variabilis]